MRTYRLEVLCTTKSPLSHIGENISNTSYLVEDSVLQPDGSLEKVFCYSGNALRGQLRDLMAASMLDELGSPRLPIDAFHLLFSGGRIGGPQTTDIAQARAIREAIPLVSILGGGIGNQILQGKLRVGSLYPVCKEAIPVLPERLRAAAERVSYADCTFLKEHSRRDDAKITGLLRHLDDGDAATHRDPDQMRIRMELLAAGVTLSGWMHLEAATDVELGALVSALDAFGRMPHLGGQSSRGYGTVDMEIELVDLITREREPFIDIADGAVGFSRFAAEVYDAYRAHLVALQVRMVESQDASLRKLLGAA